MMTNAIELCPICVKRPLDENKKISWVQCDVCEQWFHSQCLKMTSLEINNLHSYHCDKCTKSHGDSVFKRKLKRSKTQIDYIALNEGKTFAVDKSIHPHIPNFMSFQPDANSSLNDEPKKGSSYIDVLESDQLTKQYVLSTSLSKPVLIPNVDYDKSGMKLPAKYDDISVAYITDKVGEDISVEVMDVLSQQGVQPGWNMGKWKEYFYTEPEYRDRIRNVISLEISQVDNLGELFIRPEIVREMDLVDKVWQDESQERPQVTKYCLMSVKGSYTDFHIDFSGTCVYYTVCKGAKSFLMYPPTDDNLQLYSSWCQEPDQNFIWFGEYTKKKKKPSNGFKVTLQEKDLFIIPSGWIHAVYTPQDSVVIGGNYLLINSLEMHLKIGEIEKETKVPGKFRFPMINKVLWLTSWYYFNHKEEFIKDIYDTDIKQENSSEQREVNILANLIETLKAHYEVSKTKQVAKKSIPVSLIGKNVNDYLNKLDEWLALLILSP